MSRYEVRLLMELEADNKLMAVENFIGAITNEGFRVFMYRVQDMDNDPLGLDISLVQGDKIMSVTEAAEHYGLELFGDIDDIDDDEDEDIAEYEEFELPLDEESDVVNGAGLG